MKKDMLLIRLSDPKLSILIFSSVSCPSFYSIYTGKMSSGNKKLGSIDRIQNSRKKRVMQSLKKKLLKC